MRLVLDRLAVEIRKTRDDAGQRAIAVHLRGHADVTITLTCDAATVLAAALEGAAQSDPATWPRKQE